MPEPGEIPDSGIYFYVPKKFSLPGQPVCLNCSGVRWLDKDTRYDCVPLPDVQNGDYLPVLTPT